ncbi:glycoside hydrolase family 3 N-terminal domain-containing protein [Luethyella okanaganae]|uniref:beta-N-acetylhexosaminidase n=1 Tax=Luethyella okanaganae TaxID=69372 RepID=A0ABW1VC11_9MICO
MSRRPVRVIVGTAIALLAAIGGTAACAAPSSPRLLENATPVAIVDSGETKQQRIQTPSDDAVAERLRTMSLEQKIASLLVLHTPGTDGAAQRAFIDAYGLGGVILMGDNIPGTVAELAAMTSQLVSDPAFPPLIGIDQEGGEVTRVEDRAPGADVLKNEPVRATRDAFTTRSFLLSRAGVNLNFGIVADVTNDPSSFIYDRALGTDASAAAERVAAAVSAEGTRVLSTLKHFPGHGAATGDSHVGVPTSDIGLEQWRAEVAPPFQAGIDAGAEFVMFGHLSYSAIDPAPASISSRWHAILRDELGFDGISVTDDMLMLQNSGDPAYSNPSENAVAALAAGNDALLFVLPQDPSTVGVDVGGMIADIAAAVRAGRISEQGIDGSARAMLALRHLGAVDRGISEP